MNRATLIICACSIIACASGPVRAADMAQAKQDYESSCAQCHGADGAGNGPGAAVLAIKPRNFVDCAAMSKISDATLFKVIKNGGASVGLSKDMRAWSAAFDDDEIHDFVAYVRSFCKK